MPAMATLITVWAIYYHERYLKIARGVGDSVGEGMSYGNLGNTYASLGDFKEAMECHERGVKIAKGMGDRAEEGRFYLSLDICFESRGSLKKALAGLLSF